MTGQGVGPTLRMLRKASGVTLKDIEQATGVSNAYLSQMETGKIANPGPQILGKVAKHYGIPASNLLRMAGYTDLIDDTPDLMPVPLWLREAAGVLTPDDWAALRPTVEWVASLRRAGANALAERQGEGEG